MSKRKQKTSSSVKVLRVVIIGLIIILGLIATSLYLAINNKQGNAEATLKYIYSDEWNGEHYPNGMAKYKRFYTGTLDCQVLGKAISNTFTSAIPMYAKQIQGITDISAYYEKNTATIKMMFGNVTAEEFADLVGMIKNLKSDKPVFVDYEIEYDSINEKRNITTGKLSVSYEGENTMDFLMTTSNRYNTDSSPVKLTKYVEK